ncbi:MAG: T9SS type A sorting domain-containing protein [Crocinitomicaceae bacterium]|nr:T9SS type A sorting domain-containing protein [Crocinitomicaceae bacterium]
MTDLFLFNTPNVQLRIVPTDPLITFVSGAALGGDVIPDISGDTLTWDIPSAYVPSVNSSLAQLELLFTTDVSAPLNTEICFDVIAQPITGDTDPSNNVQTLCYPVLGSYDPNYIEVTPHGITTDGLINPNLNMIYTIHFQNTGNFPAMFINIKDTLDGSVLDLGSFEYLASSHTLTYIVSDGNGALVFKFDNINLPDSTSDEPNSHGWISYRIKQQPDLAPGTTIENTAHIYFDFNAPVVTNTALNTIADNLKLIENTSGNPPLTIYPVPASDLIYVFIESDDVVNFQVMDVNGKTVQTGTVSSGEQISISALQNGVYFFQLEDGTVQRILIQK